MSGFRLLPEAESDLDRILDWIERDSGRERADRMHARLLRAVRDLADYPGTGHLRGDLTARDVRVRSLDSYLIVYRPVTDPLEIVGFLHGVRDPSDLRDRIGEPVSMYPASGWEGESVVEVSLAAEVIGYVRAIVSSGRAASEADVLRHALQSWMERESDQRQKYAEWREDVRRRIDEAFDESPAESVDGPALLEELRLELEALRDR